MNKNERRLLATVAEVLVRHLKQIGDSTNDTIAIEEAMGKGSEIVRDEVVFTMDKPVPVMTFYCDDNGEAFVRIGPKMVGNVTAALREELKKMNEERFLEGVEHGRTVSLKQAVNALQGLRSLPEEGK